MTDAKRAAIEEYAKALFDEHIDAEVEKIASAIENKQIEGIEKNFDQLFSDWTWEFCGLVREARDAISESLREAIREALTT